MTDFDRRLFAALLARRSDLDNQIKSLASERDEIVAGMQSICPHTNINLGTFTYGHDSSSQTWSEGTTYTCYDCGARDDGGGPVCDAHWKRNR